MSQLHKAKYRWHYLNAPKFQHCSDARIHNRNFLIEWSWLALSRRRITKVPITIHLQIHLILLSRWCSSTCLHAADTLWHLSIYSFAHSDYWDYPTGMLGYMSGSLHINCSSFKLAADTFVLHAVRYDTKTVSPNQIIINIYIIYNLSLPFSGWTKCRQSSLQCRAVYSVQIPSSNIVSSRKLPSQNPPGHWNNTEQFWIEELLDCN